jgi:hypothetical protein
MPPKKKGHATNKKKKKRNHATCGPMPSNNNNNMAGRVQQIDGSALRGKAPDMQRFCKDPLHQELPTVYRRYKDATRDFVHYMKMRGIENGSFSEDESMSVNNLLTIADQMEADRYDVDSKALKDLKLAIRLRSRVARSVFGGGDAGHRHLLLVLNYCWSVLSKLPVLKTLRRDDATRSEEEDLDEQRNRFSVFMEVAEDEEEDEEMFPSGPVPRPEPESQPMSLEDLMKSDERTDSVIFLMTLDELMVSVSQQYQAVLRVHERNTSVGVPRSAIVEDLIEASVATNMAIQYVQQLEMDLELQYPHLTTPYRVLATVILPDFTQSLTAIVREHASVTCSEKDISIFLGDCLECAFRNTSDPLNRSERIVDEFCSQHQLDSYAQDEIEKTREGLRMMTVMEVPLLQERAMNQQFMAALQSSMPSFQSHGWLQNMRCIGGDRSILHTIRLIQAFGHIIMDTPENQKIMARRGFFGRSPWTPGRSKKTAGDLDELLMADILPQWVLLCRAGILGKQNLPMIDELAPLWVNMKHYVDHPEKSVSWTVAFSVHAMLTAILENDTIVNSLLNLSESIFGKFFGQVKWAQELSKKEAGSNADPKFKHNMAVVEFLENLGLPVFGKRAIWNPLCAGTTFSYLTYFGNLGAGCTLIDCRAQLRITMYLYHGLLINGIIRRGEIEFLDMIYDIFKSSRAIWEGPLPRRGELVQRFWMCFGVSLSDSRELSQQAREAFRLMASKPQSTMKPSWKTRKMKPIEPAEISKSYRRVCERDYHDVVDNYHTPEQRRRHKGSDYYMFAVRTNDTLDAIEHEQQLMSFNLPSCGVIMEQFVCSLTRILQWEPIIKEIAARDQNDERQGMAHMFAQYLLGALDFSPDPMDHEMLRVPLGRASSHFLREMFTRLDPKRVSWFQAIRVTD